MDQESIQDTIGYLFYRACKLRRIRACEMMEKAGLFRGQPFLLSCLWQNDGLTHSELANQAGVQPATISVALQRMEKAGLIERQPDRVDQRVSRVFLTDSGRDIRPAVEEFWQELETSTFSGFNPQEIDQFRALLQRIYNNLSQPQ